MKRLLKSLDVWVGERRMGLSGWMFLLLRLWMQTKQMLLRHSENMPGAGGMAYLSISVFFASDAYIYPNNFSFATVSIALYKQEGTVSEFEK